mgnify:FL=1
MRERASILNSPILYCLKYVLDHRIEGIWAYLWLIRFVKTAPEVIFHPEALRLIRENLPAWKNPFQQLNDYQLFLVNAFPDPKVADYWMSRAINEDSVLIYHRETQTFTLQRY